MLQTFALEHLAHRVEAGMTINIANIKKGIRINYLLAEILNLYT
jgi:hypothetical protein